MNRARCWNLLSIAILVTALVAFVAFHFARLFIDLAEPFDPVSSPPGWALWPWVLEVLEDASGRDFIDLVAIAALITAAFIIVAAPFAQPLLRRSRPLWWMAFLCSGTSAIGFAAAVLTDPLDPALGRYGPGFWCLCAAMLLNLAGLLAVRKEAASGHP